MQILEIDSSATEVSLQPLLERKYLVAFALVTSLFFMWAFAHNLNDILIRQFQKALDLNRGQSSFIQVAFYLGYFFAALPAGYAMRRVGYKNGILMGLALFAAGAFLFYPAAEVSSYPIFLIALFIIATGATFLETAANPLVTVMGDPSTGAQRLNLAQSFNGLGATIAPFAGGLLIFSGIEHSVDQLAALAPEALTAYRAEEARAVQLPYMVLGATISFIALLVIMTRFPVISEGNNEIGEASQDESKFIHVLRHKHLVWAVVTQLAYVGAQVGMWSYYIDFVKDLDPNVPEKTAANWLAISLGSFMVGRFLGTFLMRFYAPQKLLALYAMAAIVLCGLAFSLSGMAAILAYGTVSFFMSIMFPTIFALGVTNLGDDTKLGSSLIIMAIIGGAILPPIMGSVADALHIQWAVVAPAICFAIVLAFALKGYRVDQH